MMRTYLLRFLAIATIVLASPPAWSQSPPRLIPFQGKLTNPAGQAVPDGARKIQFKLYDTPTGGAAVWPGEVHTATVNAGLVNVLLGSQSLFTDPSIFNQTLYLEITADVNADGILNQADPPMLPRQLIVPVIFAPEAGRLEGSRWQDFFVDPSGGNPKDNPSAARVKDAAKLRDREWSDFFTTESVATAKAKNADLWDGIDTAALFQDAGITTNPKVKAAVLADNAVGVIGEIHTGNIAVGAVTQSKLAPVSFVEGSGSRAVKSAGVALYDGTQGPGLDPQTVLSAVMETTGRPIILTVTPFNASLDGPTFHFKHGGDPDYTFYVLRVGPGNSHRVATLRHSDTDNGVAGELNAPFTFMLMDTPQAGTYTYEVRVVAFNKLWQVINAQLVIYEL